LNEDYDAALVADRLLMSRRTKFEFDVFLSYSAGDKERVREIAHRLRQDNLRVLFDTSEIEFGDSIEQKIEYGLEHSRVLVLCASASASHSGWMRLEDNTFRFRDPVNKERRFLLIRFDEAPIKGPLSLLPYFDWHSDHDEQNYAKLLDACSIAVPELDTLRAKPIARVQLQGKADIRAFDFSADESRVLSAGFDNAIRLSELKTGRTLRVLKGHRLPVWDVAWSPDQQYAVSSAWDGTARLWDLENGRCIYAFKRSQSSMGLAWSPDSRYILIATDNNHIGLWDVPKRRRLRLLRGHSKRVLSLAWSTNGKLALSGSEDGTCRLWDLASGKCQRVLKGHSHRVLSVALGNSGRYAISGGDDNTGRLWDLETGDCVRVLEGHTGYVWSVALSANERWVLSGSFDDSIRLWDAGSGRCLRVLEGHADHVRRVIWSADQCHAISGDDTGRICLWDLSDFVDEKPAQDWTRSIAPQPPDQVQYTNAKVLIVGDTSSGKTGLAHRLATGQWKASDASTIGAWSTQWRLGDTGAAPGVEREIWLWDFGGQADQRLIHQLYMDRCSLILLLFNADQDDVLPGLRDWLTALKRCVPADTPQFLVAGRIDAGFRASRTKLHVFANENSLGYFETSALEGTGCEKLHLAIVSTIPWLKLPIVTTEQLFKSIKDEILKLRDEGQVLHTFKELRDLLRHRLPQDVQFTDDTLRTVIGHLDAPGAVKELDYGSYILLAPEWINAYAQAVIRTIRSDVNELGRLPVRSIAEGKLIYHGVGSDGSVVKMNRLSSADERVVLAEMERQLRERGLCVEQGDKLVFPSHCGRDRPAVVEHPSVFVSYAVKGYLDDLYATLVVRLADSESFTLKELWRDAADFDTLDGGHRMGIKLTRESASSGEISVYFGPGVTQEEQVIFANYIHAHLACGSEQVQRLRYYVCPKCLTPKGNPQVLMDKLLLQKHNADTECDRCENRFPLWDALERKFASRSIRDQVEGLQTKDIVRLDARRKGKLLALEVAARITSADQKCFEIPGVEDEGIDMEVEFTDADGSGTGQRIYLQLKAGNSYLRRRRDGTEIFRIKKQNWVKYWLKQDRPVLLVVGTFEYDAEELPDQTTNRFADIRWMEISALLRRESNNGTKAVKQIVFKGKRLDAENVRRWRDKALGGRTP
jgi:WD40 repeat protein